MSTRVYLVFASLLSFLLLTDCVKDNPVVPIPPPGLEEIIILDCSDLDETRQFFEDKMQDGLFIREITTDQDFQIFIYEDNSGFGFNKDCFERIETDLENWLAILTYHDGITQTVQFAGQLDLTYILNPSGFAPLCAEVMVSAPREGKVSIRVIGKNGAESDVIRSFDSLQESHSVPVLGLYPEYDNMVEVSFLNEDGNLIRMDTLQILTEDLRDALPFIQVTQRDLSKMEPGWTLVSYRTIENPSMPFMVDHWGDIRWILDYSDHPTLYNLGYDVGVESLENGNLYFGDWTTDAIYEIDRFGNIINSWPFPGYNYHHNVQEKPDGNFLVTASKIGSTHLNGNQTVADYILEINRESGSIIMEWDLKESLDEYRTTLIDVLDENPIDWAHVNAVIPDPTDNTIIISARTQALVKLDYNNKVKWILGNHQGWGENRQGEDLNQFLLDASDSYKVPLLAIFQDGFQGHPDFEWPWYHHAPFITPEGNIMLFDNGFNRNFNHNVQYSRAVEYKIDLEAMTVQQIWEYGQERGIEAFSWIVSDVDYLPNTNNILMSPGCQVQNTGTFKGGKVIELDYDTKEVVFEAELNSTGITFHRTERLTLYKD